MTKYDNGGYFFVESMKVWLFILLYLPATILTFFGYLWDGGLREFRFVDMPKHAWRMDIFDKKNIPECFERADKIWEKA